MELKGVAGGNRKRGVGGETRRAKSLRIGVHHANAVVWEPVYRTHLSALAALAVAAAAAAAASTRRRRLHLPRVLVRLRVVAEVAEVAYVAASSSPAASSSSKRAPKTDAEGGVALAVLVGRVLRVVPGWS